jgi:hypothetical protein
MAASPRLAPSTGYTRIFRQGRIAVCHGNHLCHLSSVERFSDFIVILHTSQDPYLYWGLVVLCFTMGTFSFWRGSVELLTYLREQKMESSLR